MIEDWQRAGWPVVRIRDIGRLHGGGTPTRKRPEYFQGEIPWITGQDIPDNRVETIEKARDYVTEEAVTESATRVVPAGAVLITTRVSVGKTAVAGRPICFSQDVTALLIHSEAIALPAYVAHYLRSRQPALLQKNQGSTIAGITRDSLALEQIPLPPLSEQQRIVDILQEAEEIRRLRAQAEAKTAELIPALFHQTFLSHAERSKWTETTINKVAADGDNSIRTGPFGSDLLHSEFVDSGVPVLGIDNVVSNRFRWDERRYITQSKYEGMSRFRVYPDDVMVTIMGTVGRCAIAPADLPEAISTKHLCVITPDKSQVLPTFLWASILSDPTIRAQTKAVGKGAIMEGWNSKIIRALKFLLPPLDLQRDFEKQVNEILALEECAPPSDTIAKSLTASLSAHAFTGHLTAKWRIKQWLNLIEEARERDDLLALAAGKRPPSLLGGLKHDLKVILDKAPIEPPSDGYGPHGKEVSGISREQWLLLLQIREMNLKQELPRYFTAELIADQIKGPLHRHPQAIESHLTVFAVRGIVIPVSRARDAVPGKPFAASYRLPMNEEGAPTEQRDDVKAERMKHQRTRAAGKR